jgi:hypothetical protein
VREKADSWWHGLSPSSRQDWLDSAFKALKALADAGLTAASVLANLHHRWIVPLMERRLRIFEMEETSDPVALAQSRLMPDLFPREYAATRARRVVNLRAMRTDDTTLWVFTMLPEGPLVSRVPALLWSFDSWSIVVIWNFTRPLQVMAVNAARSAPPTPRARARAAQRQEQERAARKKEKSIRRRERREQRSEEFRLREQQGLSSPGTSEYSSSDEEEEEESDGGRAPPERWEPLPPSPRAAEAAEETTPGAGTGAPAARQPMREAVRAAEAPARATGTTGGEAVAAPAAATPPAEPPRKRKRGFSTLR